MIHTSHSKEEKWMTGWSENDVMNDAFGIFNQDEGETFKFKYAWQLLKDNPKCNSKFGGGS